MSILRALHTATLLQDGRVLLAGGGTARAEIFDPAGGMFHATGALNTARYGHSATLLPYGRVLVIGGYKDGWLNSAEIYDPATGQWSATQPIFAHGLNHTATLLNDGRVLVVAGDIQSGYSGADDRVEIFDPKENSWQKAAFHENTGGRHTATLLMDGRVLIAGGDGHPAIYDPINDTWQPAGSLAFGRNFAQAVLLQDGRVLLIGGTNESTPTNSVEIYDPVSNAWQQAAPLEQARFGHAATLLPDGRVLVTGGARLREDQWNSPDAILNSVEVYSPSRNSWISMPPLKEYRMGHTATILPDDDRILTTGGYTNGRMALNNAEIMKVGNE
jgi:N-acetylneuraminic acid mutarotase